MNRRIVSSIFLILVMLLTLISTIQAQSMKMPSDKVALLYRIEFMSKDKWDPVKETKTFKKNHTIRFRFLSNCAGTLYVLNSSDEKASLEPVFTEGTGTDLRWYLGLGTHIEANQVGIFPDPQRGGGLRFTGAKDFERFLFIFIPDELEYTRAMMAIVPGAENWKFDAKTTYMATGKPGHILFHFFELKSK